MKIEVGKFYKTDSGNKVKIIYIHDKGTHPVIGLFKPDNEMMVVVLYTLNGTNRGNDNLNLVSEWQEPLDFDWDCLPKWSDRYIAMDLDLSWKCFSAKPYIRYENSSVWIGKSLSFYNSIPCEFYPKNFTGNWKDSLFKNPKYED